MMRIGVRLFAAARQWSGLERIEVELPPTATVADLQAALESRIPQLAGSWQRTLIAVNQQYAAPTATLSETDEVALIPPVSGG